MQTIIKSVGWVLYALLGTTVCESLHAATTLFIGLVILTAEILPKNKILNKNYL